MADDPTRRFTTRVDNYVKYRPGYPPQLVDYLWEQCKLRPDSSIADIGSGTGILSRVLLMKECYVYGVEPNDAMRLAGETFLTSFKNFVSIVGQAEDTSLPNQSIDLIVAGQAFHWFDAEATQREWQRILKPNGWVALIWNQRLHTGTPFLSAYEDLLRRYAIDYKETGHRRLGRKDIESFFGSTVSYRTFANAQVLDFPGLKGRLLSSSYTPGPEQPGYGSMIDALEGLFNKYQQEGHVVIPYDCMVCCGNLGP